MCMYNVLRIHITNMVCGISLRTIDFHFSYFDSFLILIDIRSNKLVNNEQVVMVLVRKSVSPLVFDNDCYLPHSIIVDDKGAVVEDATFCHDMISSFTLSIAFKRITASATRGPLIAISYVVWYQSTTSSSSFTVSSSKDQNVEIWRDRKTKGFLTSPLVNFENATDKHHEALLNAHNQIHDLMKDAAATGHKLTMLSSKVRFLLWNF